MQPTVNSGGCRVINLTVGFNFTTMKFDAGTRTILGLIKVPKPTDGNEPELLVACNCFYKMYAVFWFSKKLC